MPLNRWKPTKMLADALHPSTSKDHVLPKLDRRVFVENEKILKNFTDIEKNHAIRGDYFEMVQSEVTSRMRTILVEWMLEVCAEEQCSCEVFALAVHYVDRFLSIKGIHKHQLQALGTACLFVASKVKMVSPFTAWRLVEYTDNAVPVTDILSWELMVLNYLKWDVSSLTAFDFLDQYLHRLTLPPALIARVMPILNHLVSIAVLDFPSVCLPPSVIAASCLQVAFTNMMGDGQTAKIMLASLKESTGLNLSTVDIQATRIYDLLTEQQQYPISKTATLIIDEQIPLMVDQFNTSHCNAIMSTNIDQESSDSAHGTVSLTPTDIEDVIFS